MKLMGKNFVILMALCCPTVALSTTNLGTINTIRNGFATVKECAKEKDQCNRDPNPIKHDKALEDVLNLATTNQCVAGVTAYEKAGIKVPKCPEDSCDIKGLDNTHPSRGIFALYTGDNDLFLKDLIQSYLKSNPAGKFNLVFPKTSYYGQSSIEKLKAQPDLLELLNSEQVNIVYVETMPSVDKWMQDSFQFTTIHGKPALYQLDHGREKDKPMDERLACELAKNCDIPYYIPPDMVKPTVENSDDFNLNMGGNLEVLPGGTFLAGVKKSLQEDGTKKIHRSNFQQIQKNALEESGNKVLEIDVSFLQLGHVDEMFNFVKTDKPAPCDFAVMMASPKKAFELLEKAGGAHNIPHVSWFQFFVNSAYAGIVIEPVQVPNSEKKPFTYSLSDLAVTLEEFDDISCTEYSERELVSRELNNPVSQQEMQQIKKYGCIDGYTVQTFTKSNDYQIIKAQNMRVDPKERLDKAGDKNEYADLILRENKKLIVEELKASTGCSNPPVIDIPVFYRNGLSYTPNLVNGVVQTPSEGASQVILPRSYFAPFDEYVEKEMSKHGVKTSFVHDIGYHLKHGEVHCGTNSARICKP